MSQMRAEADLVRRSGRRVCRAAPVDVALAAETELTRQRVAFSFVRGSVADRRASTAGLIALTSVLPLRPQEHFPALNAPHVTPTSDSFRPRPRP